MLFEGIKPLVGVIHLPALPGAPRYAGDFRAIRESCRRDAETLARAGFHAVMVENFGDVPFYRGNVPAETVASMAVLVDDARLASGLPIGVNVLRNDGRAAFAIAVASGASFVRVNVLVGARVADQGVIESSAAEVLRARSALGAMGVLLVADVDVKHSAPLGGLRIDDEARDAVERGLADVIVVTGSRTGLAAERDALLAVRTAVPGTPVWLGSGVRVETLAAWRELVDGVIVGSALRTDGRPGGPIDPERARRFASAG